MRNSRRCNRLTWLAKLSIRYCAQRCERSTFGIVLSDASAVQTADTQGALLHVSVANASQTFSGRTRDMSM